ncbi:SctK family type III secretion system sorting platform protein [Achromobacter xylosoxidans]|uniref:SctK family type III secretion system sorting platform protein n=1 Tax=Alcaligenes xylosoxydans xylosoxydans TaxID=85698 RepID=UPI003246817E
MSVDPRLVGRMLRFFQLPSETLHPSQQPEFAGGANLVVLQSHPRARAALHRHWSRQILKGLGPVTALAGDINQRELAVALLPTASLDGLALRTGALLCGPRLRRSIVGAEVRALREAFGAEVMAFVREAESLHPGLPDSRNWSLDEVLRAACELGRRTVLASLKGAGPAILRRVALKMPPVSEGEAPLSPEAALELELRIIEKMDPEWLSSFPQTR